MMNMLGLPVKCAVTGFKGVAVERIEFLNGCVQYLVTPKGKDGKDYPQSEQIDEGQLSIRKKAEGQAPYGLIPTKYKLGDKVADIITGFKGVVIGAAQSMTGDARLGVRAECKDDGTSKCTWFHPSRLEFLGENIRDHVAVSRTGGPQRDAPPL